jgi:hypothetical protein
MKRVRAELMGVFFNIPEFMHAAKCWGFVKGTGLA